jgi:type III secretion protein L
MVIWLHGTQIPTGLVNGVLRAAEVESLRSLEEIRVDLVQQEQAILNAAHQQADELLAQAQAHAQELINDAHAQAQTMLEEMEAHVEQAKREGYEEGRHRNSIEWAERQTRQTQSRAQALQNMHEKLAVIVTSAVERIVHTEQRDALYQRALRSVQTLTRGASQLTLRVGPADYEAAAKAVGELKGLAANGVQLEVAVDPALKNGSCIFESELGILDASLETQLAGLRNAMGRAVHRALAHAEESELDEEPIDEMPLPDESAELASEVAHESVPKLASDEPQALAYEEAVGAEEGSEEAQEDEGEQATDEEGDEDDEEDEGELEEGEEGEEEEEDEEEDEDEYDFDEEDDGDDDEEDEFEEGDEDDDENDEGDSKKAADT